jgi:TPR repeat protein
MRWVVPILAVGLLAGRADLARADDAQDLATARAAFEAGDNAKGLPIIQALAARGNLEAIRAMAVVHLRGQVVNKDEAKAVEWMTKAAEGGFAAAQHELGILYLNGTGVEKSAGKAAAWFQKAADQGIGLSWHALGRVAADAKKSAEAEAHYRKASELGIVGAMLDLAQVLMAQGAEMTDKASALGRYAEARMWVQVSLAVIPSGAQRDDVHKIRIAIEGELKKRDAGGAARTIDRAVADGDAMVKRLREEAAARQAAGTTAAPDPDKPTVR